MWITNYADLQATSQEFCCNTAHVQIDSQIHHSLFRIPNLLHSTVHTLSACLTHPHVRYNIHCGLSMDGPD